ncbi:MAG: hypothetical protein CVU07_07445 [Bacteroidetes bacterium HGW-Bacteroidetes-23]|nr:MAG: hypothetical protein CVU07_07445 [Bacteroidetes bacterium HGW-Bacteroidetes-23]
MKLDENSGGVITLKEAQDLVSAFQTKNPDEKKAFFVGGNHLKAILNQERCIGIRVYNAYDGTNKTNTIVWIGVDENGNDIKDGVIVDKSEVCPPICSLVNLLD